MDLHDQPDPTRRANAFLRKSSNDALTASLAFDVLQRPSCALHKLCPQTMPETRFEGCDRWLVCGGQLRIGYFGVCDKNHRLENKSVEQLTI